ncbi:MAG: D-glycero-alpha-D-manno-heptose-1,7-bisphosphate 7-phosphatase [Desulfohalobiaceae bacterium]
MQSLIKNLLLDRDGTLIQDRCYLADPRKVRLLPGVIPSLQALHQAGVSFYLVSNQSGLGRGYFSFRDYQAVQAELRRQLAAYGLHLEAELFCSHSPLAGCGCRKPGTLLWHSLRSNLGLLPQQSAMLGDKPSDLEFGLKAGLRLSVMLGPSKSLSEISNSLKPGMHQATEVRIVPDMPAACSLILNQL